MAFVDKSYKRQDQDGSSQPLGQGQQSTSQPTEGQTSPNAPVAAPNPEQGQPSTKPKSTNKKGPASSGMFTNIQNYVDKNKAHAQKMSDSSLDKIRESSERLKTEKKNALSQFTDRSNQDGMTDVDARLGEFNQYVNTEANQDFVQPVQEATTETPVEPLATAQTAPPAVASDVPKIPVKDKDGNITGHRDVVTGEVTEVDPNATERVMPTRDAVEQRNKFERIINAEYGGPRSLVEAGDIYSRLAKQAKRSSKLGDLTQTTEGRGNLLNELFNREGQGYTRGQNELDNLLMGNQVDSVKEMQRAGQEIGSYDDIIRQAGSEAGSIAQTASGKVDSLRDLSRESFGNIAEGRQGEVDQRVDDVIKNWDALPAYFRNIMSNEDGTVNMSAVEASILGVGQGEGFYNLTGDEVFGTAEDPAVIAQRNQLVSKKEQSNLARLNALSGLARSDKKLYDIGKTDFSDSSVAGTQSASDALDLQRVRDKMAGAEREMRDSAGQTITGKGKGRASYDKGLWQGRGWKDKKATAKGNVKSHLADAGYDFDSDISQVAEGNSDILNQLGKLANYDADTDSTFMQGQFGNDGAAVFNSLDDLTSLEAGNFLEGIGIGPLNIEGPDVHDILGDNVFSDAASFIGGGVEDLVGGLIGGGEGAASKEAAAIAKRNAQKDLQKRTKDKFDSLNFDRRSSIGDTEESKAREEALYELMKNLDTTNT